MLVYFTQRSQDPLLNVTSALVKQNIFFVTSDKKFDPHRFWQLLKFATFEDVFSF